MSRSQQNEPYAISKQDEELLNSRSWQLGAHEFLFYFILAFLPDNEQLSPQAELPDALGFSVRNDGTELARAATDGDFAGFELVFTGLDFEVDVDGNPTGGTASSMEVFKNGDSISTFEFLVPFAITDLLDAIEAGSGDVYTPLAYAEFSELLVPSFGFLIATGSKGSDTFYSSPGDDRIDGKKGNDVMFMLEGDDKLDGNIGSDLVDARYVADAVMFDLTKGRATYGDFTARLIDVEKVIGSDFGDTIKGSSVANWLLGNGGDDTLFGRGGKDIFAFVSDGSTDQVKDFQDGTDKLDLQLFGFESKAAALAAFAEVGNKKDGKSEFSFEGTTVQITGADLKDITGADILI